jgi:L-lactate dehydrogenase complex protein LldF
MSETHEMPLLKKAMMKAAGVLLGSPALYRAALPVADSALRHLPRFALYNKMNTWGRQREMPHAPRQTFHQWYRQNRPKSQAPGS